MMQIRSDPGVSKMLGTSRSSELPGTAAICTAEFQQFCTLLPRDTCADYRGLQPEELQ